MLAIASLLVVFSLSVLLVRVGTHALNMTGLSLETARFQALSALSGTGFTTGESEQVLRTRARRRIVTLLIRAGSLGIVTAVSTLVLSFVDIETGGPGFWRRLALLVAGSAGLYSLANSEAFDRFLTRVIRRALRDYTDLELADYAHVLHLTGEYRITEVDVTGEDCWLASGSLADLRLRREGIVVLGVYRDGSYVGAPDRGFRLRDGDKAVLYGRRARLVELSEREADDRGAHEDAIAEQSAVSAAEHEGAGEATGRSPA